ncbi:MAG: hypothetical protein K0R03_382 [Moraxellaceae bacterium]|jgi:hypothetical protein|nr:hypothetical protein [Moraxellaceae bacterium]
MLKPRTLKVLALLLVAYGLLWLFATLTSSHSSSPLDLLLLAPLLSVYAFHRLGVPGLLEHNGLCGWGWCAPTMLGWLFAAAFMLISVWLIAWAIASLTARLAAR